MNFKITLNGNTSASIKAHGVAVRTAALALQNALVAAREVTHGRNYPDQAMQEQDVDTHYANELAAQACGSYGLRIAIAAQRQE
tara:strand:+ start:5368 stop:5619 length:252 start_codon:yes stop_codon:yes gene_type:complete